MWIQTGGMEVKSEAFTPPWLHGGSGPEEEEEEEEEGHVTHDLQM